MNIIPCCDPNLMVAFLSNEKVLTTSRVVGWAINHRSSSGNEYHEATPITPDFLHPGIFAHILYDRITKEWDRGVGLASIEAALRRCPADPT